MARKISFPVLLLLLVVSAPAVLAAEPSRRIEKMPPRDDFSPRPTKFFDIKKVPTLRIKEFLSGTPKPSLKPKTTPGIKSCAAREAAIKTRSENLVRFSQKVIETFDKIVARVKEFYVTKKLNVSNYSALTADVAAKRTAALNATTKAAASIVGFSCTSGEPKTLLETFNSEMKNVHQALKDYKTSVRNLIVGIHSQSDKVRPTKGEKQGDKR